MSISEWKRSWKMSILVQRLSNVPALKVFATIFPKSTSFTVWTYSRSVIKSFKSSSWSISTTVTVWKQHMNFSRSLLGTSVKWLTCLSRAIDCKILIKTLKISHFSSIKIFLNSSHNKYSNQKHNKNQLRTEKLLRRMRIKAKLSTLETIYN